jgi:hypothetical protein
MKDYTKKELILLGIFFPITLPLALIASLIVMISSAGMERGTGMINLHP